jgi:peptide-methionine (S)-S-oxide reductase
MLNSFRPRVRSAAFALCASVFAFACARADEPPRPLPAPTVDAGKPAGGGLQTAVLSGGCFWGMQGVFEHVKGVRQVLAGYSGGAESSAHYEDVSGGATGHAESVKIVFNPGEVTYGQLLRVFFSVAHDPTQLNRQGPDSGTNYRSNIFFADAMQQKIAQAYIEQIDKAHILSAPIVTRVDRFVAFYPAEAYHQDYLFHNPDSGYIVVNDLPKIGALKRVYPELYRDAPVTVSARAPS